MTIDIDRNGSELLVTLEGKLDVLNSEELDKKLRQELLTAQRLVVDLIGVRYGQHRTTRGLRLCTSSACIFSVIAHKFSLPGVSPPSSNLCTLTKNLTAHLTHRGCAVLPMFPAPACVC